VRELVDEVLAELNPDRPPREVWDGLPDEAARGVLHDCLVEASARLDAQRASERSEPDPEAQTLYEALTEGVPVVSYRWADQVKPERPVWMWRGWLVAGMLHLLVGRKGGGKTTFTAWLVAQLTKGTQLPGEDRPVDALRVGVLSLEEPADRVSARLDAAGADMSRVAILEEVIELTEAGQLLHRPWRLPKDVEALGRRIAELEVDVVVIDGVGYAIDGDSHNYAIVGTALTALGKMCERVGCAVVGIVHPPKGASDLDGPAIGSVAWTTVARVMWLLGADPNDPSGERRAVTVGPTNYRRPPSGFVFKIVEGEHEAPVVEGLTAADVSAGDLLARLPDDDDRSKREVARDWLDGRLGDGDWHRFTEILADAQVEQISERTLQRAATDLNVEKGRAGTGRDHHSRWRLLPTPENGLHGDPLGRSTDTRSDQGELALDGSELEDSRQGRSQAGVRSQTLPDAGTARGQDR
jgi:putative DNA primase/helicase